MERPNILLLFSDQHSALARDLDVGTSPQTPRLDALAAQGANFSNAYCNAPICVPSRMSFLSARQPSEVGGFENDDRLSPLHATFVHGLAAGGYRTVLCGKMHFLDPDYFHGYQENVLGEPVQGLFADVHFDTPHPWPWNAMGVNPLVFSGPGSQAFQHYDRAVATNSARIFASHPHREKPLFLTAGFMLPHNPYVCRPDRFAHHYERIDLGKLQARLDFRHAHSPYLEGFLDFEGVRGAPLEAHRRALAAYFGLCEEVDENIGRVLDSVSAAETQRPTVIIYSSDHGEAAGINGLWFKCSVTEDSTRVPMSISGPAIAAGPRHKVVGLTDLAVTICSLAGVAPPPHATGISFADCLHNPGCDTAEGTVICESVGRPGAGPLWMMRRGRWKFVHCHNPELEILCDLEADPAECHNLIRSPEHASLAQNFRAHRQRCWDPVRVQSAWEKRRDERSYVEAAGRVLTLPPPQEMRPRTGWNRFDAGALPREVLDFLRGSARDGQG